MIVKTPLLFSSQQASAWVWLPGPGGVLLVLSSASRVSSCWLLNTASDAQKRTDFSFVPQYALNFPLKMVPDVFRKGWSCIGFAMVILLCTTGTERLGGILLAPSLGQGEFYS